jgi:hypothetical protein
LTKLLPNVDFNGSIRPDIAGSPSFGKLESRPKPTPEENQRHCSRATEAMKAFSGILLGVIAALVLPQSEKKMRL